MFRAFVVAPLLLAIVATSAQAQETRRVGDFQQAIGMPGSLGIAGLDALTEFCAGKRDPAFRADAVALIERNFSEKWKSRLIEFYDKRHAEWQAGYRQKRQKDNRDKICSDESFHDAKNPDKHLWVRFASKIGYPGF